jgi:hypothetical protein
MEEVCSPKRYLLQVDTELQGTKPTSTNIPSMFMDKGISVLVLNCYLKHKLNLVCMTVGMEMLRELLRVPAYALCVQVFAASHLPFPSVATHPQFAGRFCG